MLKRYLRTRYGLSPEAYRTKWGLPRDYPMVAPNYAAQRSAFAK
jgi:predicted transcriptional regulator